MFSSLKRTVLMVIAALIIWAHLSGREHEHSRQQIEQDLALHAALQSPSTIQVGGAVDVSMLLRNGSADRSYSIVKPGDGSEAGWREPHLFYTATLDGGDGVFKPVPTKPYLRCGLFDPNWQKDVHRLKPGEEFACNDWAASPSDTLEFQEAGRVRLVAHYSFRAGVNSKGAYPGVATGPMGGVPAFELVSSPVEFDVVRPLDLVLTVKAPLTVKEKARTSDVLDIRLVNRSQNQVEISTPAISADAFLFLTIEGKFNGWRPSINPEKMTRGRRIVLEAGEEVAVIGAGAFANGIDGTWEYPVEDNIRVRAAFHTSIGKSESVILSNWAEIKATQNKGAAQ